MVIRSSEELICWSIWTCPKYVLLHFQRFVGIDIYVSSSCFRTAAAFVRVLPGNRSRGCGYHGCSNRADLEASRELHGPGHLCEGRRPRHLRPESHGAFLGRLFQKMSSEFSSDLLLLYVHVVSSSASTRKSGRKTSRGAAGRLKRDRHLHLGPRSRGRWGRNVFESTRKGAVREYELVTGRLLKSFGVGGGRAREKLLSERSL